MTSKNGSLCCADLTADRVRIVGNSKFSKSYKVAEVAGVAGVVGDSKFSKSYKVAGVAELQ